ncbi:MAG TPA: pimeloyl-ACP methyl ester esterase BioH [Casimicrobiaceae bacterium]
MREADVTIDPSAGTRALHVDSVGAGAPLVLLHGFAMHGGLFAPLVDALAAHRRVFVVDLPGHGRSAPAPTFTLDALVGAVDAAIATDIPLDVVGWSLGGQVALEWARVRRARIRKLVLVATTPSFVGREGWPHAMSALTLARFGDELRVDFRLTLARFLALQVHGSDEGRATLAMLRTRLLDRGEPAPAVLAAALGLLRETDLRERLASIATPALVIGGDRDAIVPIEATRRLAAALPNARHATIAGAAHAPFLSHTGAFVDVVLAYLDE